MKNLPFFMLMAVAMHPSILPTTNPAVADDLAWSSLTWSNLATLPDEVQATVRARRGH